MHADGAVLPVGRRADAALVDAALVDQAGAHGAHRGCLAGGPDIALPRRQFQPAQRRQQFVAFGAIQPVQFAGGVAAQIDTRLAIVDLDDHHHALAGRQFLDPARDRGQRRFVADQQVPVERRRDHEGTARPADAQPLSGLRLRRPAGARAIAVQHEFDIELARRGVVAARGVVARDRARLSFRKHRTVGPHLRQHRALLSRRRQEHLDMVVERGRHEVGEIVAGKGHAQQRR